MSRLFTDIVFNHHSLTIVFNLNKAIRIDSQLFPY